MLNPWSENVRLMYPTSVNWVSVLKIMMMMESIISISMFFWQHNRYLTVKELRENCKRDLNKLNGVSSKKQ